MTKTIFQKEDFQLCNFPVPKGYPYAQTHVGIAYKEEGICGNYWFAVTSPYPNPKRNVLMRIIRFFARKILHIYIKPSDWYENPLFYYSNQNKNIPTTFSKFSGNPLMKTPNNKYGLGGFNSDPDIYIENNDIYVLNRPTWRKQGKNNNIEYEAKLFLIKIICNNKVFYKQEPIFLFDFEHANASPCLIYFKGKYRIFSLNSSSYNTGLPCSGAEMRTSDSIYGRYEDVSLIKICTEEYQPWHFSIFEHKGILYSIVACIKGREKKRCYQMLGEFNDELSELTIYQTPLTDMHSYRGDAVVLKDGTFVLYSSIIEKFTKSKSVDNRDIVVAKDKFELIIKKLRCNK